ncbi:hypothetical protein MHTCC0001_09580 [Flavobacteriaceae bacterium MHTCC 0001]
MDEKKDNFHGDTKLYWYSKLLEVGKVPIFREIGLLISLIFVRIAPEIPISLKKSYTGPDGKRAGIIGFIITFIFAFVINLIATYLSGTFYGDDPNIIYFRDDWYNIVLYTIVCPTYVGLTCWLVVLVIKGWAEINDFKNEEIYEKRPKHKFYLVKAIALSILVLSVAFFLTTNYINDVVALKKENICYWFLTPENYELGSLGVYYFLLNFSLLIITLIALTFFMSIYRLIMNVGRALESRNEIGNLEFEKIKIKLSVFTEAYIITKGIIAAYVANLWIWSKSPLAKGTDENFGIALILLTFIGFLLISFPRYFVELQWYKLKLRSPNSKILDMKHEDLRTFEVKKIAQILDWIFIGGLAFDLIKHYVKLS